MSKNKKCVYFTRHGQTFWNVEDKICGSTDIALTEYGQEQAIALGQKILEEGLQIDEILYSPLIRAADTARHISEITGIPAIEEPRLKEQNFGKYEGTSPRNAPEFQKAKTNFICSYEGGETMLHLCQRIYNLLDDLKERNDGKTYLLDMYGIMQTGWQNVEGRHYYMDSAGVMQTGWQYVNGYKLYFKSNGALQQDVSSMVSGPYRLRVNRTTCMVTVFAKDGSNGYIIPVKSMTCSVGLPATPTPTGTFYIGDQDRWHILMGPSWGQYTSHVYQGIFIHSVAGGRQNIYNLNAADYNNLGRPASHGYIRLCVRDAKWIYTNVSRGSQITIGDGYYEPFDKPATIKLAPGTNLMDPTQC